MASPALGCAVGRGLARSPPGSAAGTVVAGSDSRVASRACHLFDRMPDPRGYHQLKSMRCCSWTFCRKFGERWRHGYGLCIGRLAGKSTASGKRHVCSRFRPCQANAPTRLLVLGRIRTACTAPKTQNLELVQCQGPEKFLLLCV
ncbi:hypothetical protein EE612_012523 [Oryza sativa]|nr:hypothetical protein EE612_012523 [Oryza sativa]